MNTFRCRHTEPCIWSMEGDEAWDAINKEMMDTTSPAFMETVRRRNAKQETWGVYAWGGIFDIITTIPFPGRDK